MNSNQVIPDTDLELIKDGLQVLWNSCEEGLQGWWNPVGEGAEGFEDMQQIISDIAKPLGLTITGYTGDMG